VYRPVNHHRRRCLPVIGRRWVVQHAATALTTTAKAAMTLAGRAWSCSHPVAVADQPVSRLPPLAVCPVAAGSQYHAR